MSYLDSSLGRYQGGNDPGREHLAMRGSEWMSMTEHDVCTGRGIDAGSKNTCIATWSVQSKGQAKRPAMVAETKATGTA